VVKIQDKQTANLRSNDHAEYHWNSPQVVKRPRWSVLGFRLEEGILSGWSRGDGGGKSVALGGGSVGGVWGGV